MGREEAHRGLEREKYERVGAHDVKAVAGVVRVQEMDLEVGRSASCVRHNY
jgi:hypothetical protein